MRGGTVLKQDEGVSSLCAPRSRNSLIGGGGSQFIVNGNKESRDMSEDEEESNSTGAPSLKRQVKKVVGLNSGIQQVSERLNAAVSYLPLKINRHSISTSAEDAGSDVTTFCHPPFKNLMLVML